MLKQFNANFIDLHLVPFFKEVLKDAAENPKEYHKHMFVSGFLTERQKQELERDYFTLRKNDSRIPFTSDNDSRERHELIDFLVEYIGKYSSAGFERGRAFLPVKLGESDVFQFHDVPNRNIHLMAYGLMHQFEKRRLQELVQQKKEAGDFQGKYDEMLLQKGQLMLVKKGNDFTDYIRKEEAKERKVVPFSTKPSLKTAKILGGASAEPEASVWSPGSYGSDVNIIQDETLTDEELLRLFEDRQSTYTLENLEAYNMQLVNTATATMPKQAIVTSGGMQFELNVRLVRDEKSKKEGTVFDFRFLEGTLAGQSFSLTEEELQQFSKKEDGTRRTLEELYKLWKEQKTVKALEELSQKMPLDFANKENQIPSETTTDRKKQTASFRLPEKKAEAKTDEKNTQEYFEKVLPGFKTKDSPPHDQFSNSSQTAAKPHLLEQAKLPSIMDLKDQMRKKREFDEKQPTAPRSPAYSPAPAPTRGKQQEEKRSQRKAPSKKGLSPGAIAAIATGGAVAGTFGAIVGIPFLF